MADAMTHRGPDGHGVWVDGPVGLSHRRLAIIDLDGGRQPMVSPWSGAVLAFNGEVYNFRTLRAELAGLGVRFLEQSDTEVVLRAYEHWGERCVEHLDGMFAFAIWDPRTEKVFAARDRLGIKPFYYHARPDVFVFASELKALSARGDLRLEVDQAAFESYLRLQYIPAPASIFKRVCHLLPGHTITATRDGLHVTRYWRPRPITRGSRSIQDEAKDCTARLALAVESHLVADVPVGALLSGGLDSSVIVAHMAAHGPVRTFSIGFEGGPRFDERAGARLASTHLKTIHRDRLVTDADAVRGVPAIVSRMDEPLADFAALPTFFVAEMAAQDVKVVLTGEGADELFGGYRRYWKERVFAPLKRLRARYQATHLFTDAEIRHLIGRPLQPIAVRTAEPSADPATAAMLTDLEGWLPDDLLVKVDRMTMMCSLEARVPYLDHRFVEWALTVPSRRNIGLLAGRRKMVLRESARELLPATILNRPKHGFTPPVDAWFRGKLGTLAAETLLDASSPLAQRIDPAQIDLLMKNHANGATNGHKLWALLIYDLWSRHYGVS